MWYDARMQTMRVDGPGAKKLLEELVSIDSVNPTLVPGAAGEALAAASVRNFLRARGVAAEFEPVAPERPNVVARIGQPGVKPGLLVVAHLDTVGGGDMREPFTPREREGRLFGRGALDIKSGVAAMCAAAAAMAPQAMRLSRPVLVAGVVDEECNSIGTEALLRNHTADAAVVLEPTDLGLVVAHKGYAWFEITTHGRAAHGSLPGEGRDAIRMMGRVLNMLDALEKKLAMAEPHARLGMASLHASLISGGQELSSYPAECKLQVERRTLPGETPAAVEAELRARLAALGTRDPEFQAALRALGARPGYEIAEDSLVVQKAKAAIRRACGGCEVGGMSAWTDTALLAAAGIPGIVFGPSGRGLHGTEEYVELESVTKCADALGEMILEFCA